MNIKPHSIKILCYGDSNTWGDPPDSRFNRYPSDIRWTGLLQKELGEDIEVIEEGLCGRTTVLDDPKEEGRNGKTYLTPCLLSHNPIDIVLLMLGTNDLKDRFNFSAKQIAENTEELVEIIIEKSVTKSNMQPKIYLISPIHVNEHAQTPVVGAIGAEEKSKQFANYYKEVAARQGCEFIDMAQYAKPSNIDGCHLEPEGHAAIARALIDRIKGDSK
jgi:lysophospholipase L1-like esterase